MALKPEKKIKIGVVGPSWPFRGGIAKFTTQLAENLAKRGHLGSFIVPQKQYPGWLFPGKTDRDEKACKKLSVLKPLYSYYEPWTWSKVVENIQASDVDCVVVPQWSLASSPFLSYLTRRTSKPVIPIIHNFSDHDSKIKNRRWMEWTLKKGSAFIHHNPEYSSLNFFKKRSDRVACQLHPVSKASSVSNKGSREKFHIPKSSTVFLFFGLIRPYKGLDTLLDAIQLLNPNSSMAFLIAGEPWKDKNKIQNKIHELSKKYWIHSNLNWIPEEEARYWFSACDAVVCPYIKATGSGVVAQALAYKKPVLTTKTGSLNHVICDGVNGLVCPPNSPVELAKTIERFLDDKVQHKLKIGCSTFANDSWDEYVNGLLKLAHQSQKNMKTLSNLN